MKSSLPLFPATENPPSSVCLLRLSSLGDVCHAIPMIQAIQRHWPNCKITWIVGKAEAPLLTGLPGLELIVFDKSQGFKAFRQLRHQLAGRNFDVLLHMQVSIRASLASLCIPAKLRLGFDRKRAREAQWLFTNCRVSPQHHAHVLQGFQGFAYALGVPEYQPRWHLPQQRAEQDWAREHLPQDRPIMVICPATSKQERNWRAEGYAGAAHHAHQRGLSVVLCGGPSKLEQQLAGEICRLARVPCTNLVGQTSLKQLLAVLSQAALLLAPDTGPAHMAVAVDTPVLGLYAHSNPRRTGPYKYRHYVINHYDENVEEQYGKPWQELAWGTRAKSSGLMDEISVEEVLAMLERLLANEMILPAEQTLDDEQPARREARARLQAGSTAAAPGQAASFRLF